MFSRHVNRCPSVKGRTSQTNHLPPEQTAGRYPYNRRKVIDSLDDIFKYIWLIIVALIGAITGYFTRTKDIKHKTGKDKVKLFILGITTSMFISYITYEMSLYFFHVNGMAVALAGLASFTGTDFAVALEKGLLDFIERKFRSL